MSEPYYDQRWPHTFLDDLSKLNKETALNLAIQIRNLLALSEFASVPEEDITRLLLLGSFDLRVVPAKSFSESKGCGQLTARREYLKDMYIERQFRIYLLERMEEAKRRLVILHEIGHSFHFNRDYFGPIIAGFADFGQKEIRDLIDYFCTCFATRVLLPDNLVDPVSVNQKGIAKRLNEIGKIYGANPYLIIWQLADYSFRLWDEDIRRI